MRFMHRSWGDNNKNFMDPFHVTCMSTCKSLRLSVHTINCYWNIRGKLKVQLESAIYSKLGGFFPRGNEKKKPIIKIQKIVFLLSSCSWPLHINLDRRTRLQVCRNHQHEWIGIIHNVLKMKLMLYWHVKLDLLTRAHRQKHTGDVEGNEA